MQLTKVDYSRTHSCNDTAVKGELRMHSMYVIDELKNQGHLRTWHRAPLD